MYLQTRMSEFGSDVTLASPKKIQETEFLLALGEVETFGHH